MPPPLRTKSAPPVPEAARPLVSLQAVPTLLNGLAVAVFFVSCMLLPLVGRAAALTAWYRSNVLVYAGILSSGLVVSLAALLAAKKAGRAPGRIPFLMAGLFVVMLALLALGRFKA
ncbi:MAG: hypothetical protein U1F87_10580 [Kiritimatiellia bacterium]